MLDSTVTHRTQLVLDSLNAALEEGDVRRASDLFATDSYWRDLVAVSWNLKTVEGPPGVAEMLTRQLAHTRPGNFQIQTGELPAGALSSDVSIESSPLMAIDKDTGSSWISEPDGATPKWLKVDLKDVYDVTEVTLRSPNQPSPSDKWTYRNEKGQDRALVLNDDGSYEAKTGEDVQKGKWIYEGAKEIFTLSPKEGNSTIFSFNAENDRFEKEPDGNPHLRGGILEVANQHLFEF